MFKDDKKKKLKTLWQKIWYFIWEDDSIWSWIVNIIIAFVLIKFLIYPGMGLVLGTTHPVVAVVSGSMEHRTVKGTICGQVPDDYKENFEKFWATCGDFYTQYGITKENFQKYSFKNGFNTGDIIVLLGKKPKDIDIGDVIVFQATQPDPIIHRVIAKWEDNGKYYYTTKGDHNPGSIYFETSIEQERVIGKAIFRIPYLGYIKIWFVDLLKMIGLGNTVGRLF
jgi:signal peptidase I